ncbi:thiol peroxidase [Mycoplasma phocoenae]|uniref:Thiol peroxidase n=1 Tax=Mycoplasma phocoenae TaxID=754517 RepID=A0A858U3B0_9MOLU|nr:thiol peroxidase [Mycoplasma phocoenae]QJG66960.1 thiol peroxidase [Mycoplasma phocoenae]
MDITFKGKSVTLLGSQLSIGDTFPNFKAVKNDMSAFELSELGQTKKLVFSIPSIDTGVCEMETTKFMNEFKNLNFPAAVISCDLPFALNRYCVAKNNKTLITLSEYLFNDFGHKTGTKIKELGLLTRAVFVLDENNKILHVEYVKEVSSEPDYSIIMSYFQ